MVLQQETYNRLFESFRIAVIDDDDKMDDVMAMGTMLMGLKCGYVFSIEACSMALKKCLLHFKMNPNSTFYKTWDVVFDASEWQLRLDQIMHYMSTYGGFGKPGTNGYVPNDHPVEIDFTNYTDIEAKTLLDTADVCIKLLNARLALSKEVINMCCDVIVSAMNKYPEFKFNIDDVNNKESMALLCDAMGILPKSPVEKFRYLFYKASDGETLVIKSKDAIERIKKTVMRCSLDSLRLKECDIIDLSSVFYRFKPLFLAMRRNPALKPVINRIRRLAEKHHKPLKIGFFESLCDSRWSVDDVISKTQSEKNIFKMIRAVGYLNSEIEYCKVINYKKTYIIRNGSTFTREYNSTDKHQRMSVDDIAIRRDIIYNEICRRISAFVKKNDVNAVKLSKRFTLTAPISEKLFFGNMPLGTSYKLKKNNYFGIYWRNEWGTYDFDISYITSTGHKYGWNGDYCDGERTLMYSGDMTNAEPEAVEMIYGSDIAPDGIIYFNRYSGEIGSRARLFFGSDNIPPEYSGNAVNYMVDPNSIDLKVDVVTGESCMECMGIVLDGRYYCLNVSFADLRASSTDPSALYGLRCKLAQYIPLEQFLKDANVPVVYDDGELGYNEEGEPIKPAYDFSENITKDSLISFFTDISNNTTDLFEI